jgi:glycosyltransferase involved in cell wall biosynthesis
MRRNNSGQGPNLNTLDTPATTTGAAAPRCSVVIPLFNKAGYVSRAIDSVLAQTFPHFELLVVDDGSTDGSAEAVRRYQEARIRLITQENAGEGAARNRGIAEARTDWIALLDADDEWLPRFLEKAVAAVESHPAAAMIFTNLREAAQGTLWNDDSREREIADYLRYYTDNDGRGMTASSVFIRKAPLLQAGGFPPGVRHGGDVDTWTRLALSGNTAYYIAEPLAIYHNEAAGSVMKDGLAKVLDAPWVTVRTCQRWREEGRIPPHLHESALRMIQCMYIRYIRFLIAMNDRAAAREFLRANCTAKLCGRGRYWKTYLRTFTPEILMPMRRFLHKIYLRLASGK